MMRQIQKFTLQPIPQARKGIIGFQPRTIGIQRGNVVVWGETNVDTEECGPDFFIRFTGEELLGDNEYIVDTFYDKDSGLVWHLTVYRATAL